MTLVVTAVGIFAVLTSIFLVSENRRPQATLAWLLVLFFLPGLGLLIYVLFGRDRKGFSKQTKLLMQDLEANARPLLDPLFTEQVTAIAMLEAHGTSYRKLMHLVRENSRSVLTIRNRATILQDSSEFYPAMIADIEAAQHSIHLQYYIWRSDALGRSLQKLLCEKVRQGVQVRLLYDPVGSIASRRSYYRQLRRAGISVAPTSPLWHLHTISYRNHRKISIIDGRVAYTGGMNIGSEHIDGGGSFNSWRDTQLRIEGQGAAVLQAVFMIDWYNATRENAFAPEYFPKESDDPQEQIPANVAVQILTSGPDSRWEAIRQLYAVMIATARRHVYIQSPYLILDSSLAEALRTAALSGIDVRVMMSEVEPWNPLPSWAGNTYAESICRSGVRVYHYRRGYLHAKTISVDSQICSIGSANIDIRSFSINYELNAVLYDEKLTAQLEMDFHRDLQYCTEFDADEYHQRNRLVRFRDSVARLLSPLL